MNQRKEARKQKGLERQMAYDKLTIQEKLDRLPSEPHANKQRQKLLAQLEGKKTKKVEPVEVLSEEQNEEERPTRAKDRRSKERRQ